MTSVWYLGSSRVRTITVSQWKAAGYADAAEGTTWDINNGWSVPESQLHPTQLVILDADPAFVLHAPDGPRPGAAGGAKPPTRWDDLVTEARLSEELDKLSSLVGKSAYEIAVDNGFIGTETQWLATMVGPEGPPGTPGERGERGPQGEQGQQGIQGNQGIKGDKGDKGNKGDTGSSAYQAAVALGFVGSELEWLDTLIGPEGPVGQQGLQGIQGIQGERGLQGVKGDKGDKGDRGDQGQGIQLKGSVATYGALPTTGNTIGDAWIVNGNGKMYVWTGEAWPTEANGANVQGPQGIQGVPGIQGEKGAKGDKGDQGNVGPKGDTGLKGDQGIQGPVGKSAYQVAVDDGFEGTLAQWLDSLVGPAGETGEQGIQGNQGIQGIQGVKGERGLSAFEVAQAAGFTGSQAQWLAALKGDTGLKGDKGDKGDAGPVATWSTIAGKPAVVAEGANKAAARNAIDAVQNVSAVVGLWTGPAANKPATGTNGVIYFTY